MRSIVKKFFQNRIGYNDEQLTPLSNIFKYFWKINWLKTILFNFTALPFYQAIRLPFIVGYKCRIRRIGKVILKGRVSPGMISIGVIRLLTDSNAERLVWANMGEMFFNGRAKFHPGSKISVKSKGVMKMGERVSIGSCTKLVCTKSIEIGKDTRISWECQIFDTDFHFLRNINKGKIYDRQKNVIIGNDVFIGNSSTVGKGTILPSGSVVSCCSKVSGDFSDEGFNLLIVGNPAKVVKKGVQMSSGWFSKKEHNIAIQKGE